MNDKQRIIGCGYWRLEIDYTLYGGVARRWEDRNTPIEDLLYDFRHIDGCAKNLYWFSYQQCGKNVRPVAIHRVDLLARKPLDELIAA